MGKRLYFFHILLIIIEVFSFHYLNNTVLMWVCALFGFICLLKQTNYLSARIPLMLNIFLITLCGNTNYLLFFCPIDFFIAILLLLLSKKHIKIRIAYLLPWVMMSVLGVFSGLLYAKDDASFHVGVEVYFLLTILMFSSEVLCGQSQADSECVELGFLSTNIGVVLLFWLSNSLGSLSSTTRSLIKLLGYGGIKSNTLAGVLSVFFIVVLFTPAGKDRIKRIAKILLLTVDGVTLLFLQSRGCYIAILVALLYSEVNNIRISRKINRLTVAKFLLLMTFAIIIYLLPNSRETIDYYMFSRFYTLSDVSNGRFSIYKSGLNMWLLHPVIGNGFLQFYAHHISTGDPHNFVIGYLCSVGILGTVALLVFLIKILRINLGANSIKRALKYTILLQIIHGLFEPVLTTSLPLSLFVLCCIAILYRYNESKQAKQMDESELNG